MIYHTSCRQCGVSFSAERSNPRQPAPRFCSQRCYHRSRRREGPAPRNFTATCEVCGIEFATHRSPAAQRKYRTRFCSTKCKYKGQSREGAPAWNGGRHIDRGYIQIFCPDHPRAQRNGYIYEHRLVMEAVLGRLLEPWEVVHHKNGVTTDNRPENLHLFASQAEHMRFHKLKEAETQ
jgi:hypothetical protein